MSRRVNGDPLKVACPTCRAGPQLSCYGERDGWGYHYSPPVFLDTCHASRVRAAKRKRTAC